MELGRQVLPENQAEPWAEHAIAQRTWCGPTLLFHLAPNGYPDPYKLRDLFVKLHDIYGILSPRHEADKDLSLASVAILAADRWRIMCKHCLMIFKGGNTSPVTTRA